MFPKLFFSGDPFFLNYKPSQPNIKDSTVLSKSCFLLKVILNAHAEPVGVCLWAAIVIEQSINQSINQSIRSDKIR